MASQRPQRLKIWKPTSPGQRGRITVDRYNLWKGRPMRDLTVGLSQTGGRTNSGRISVWHKGGGAKRLYRLIDFRRSSQSAGVVERIEYDPNRSARIALIRETINFKDVDSVPSQDAVANSDGVANEPSDSTGAGAQAATASTAASRKPILYEYKYMLAPQGIGAGDAVSCSPDAPIKPGMTLPLASIPSGTEVHNIELRPGRGGQMCRAAGTCATLVKNEEDGYTVLRLPSGEMRKVLSRCKATVGVVGNALHKNRKLGKAGISRHLGIRPTTRALAMNPRDHPASGKAKKLRKTPWGKVFMGVKTRDKKKPGGRFILLSRHKARELKKR